MPVTAPRLKTLADLLERLGGVPLDRIRFEPRPGTATVQDVIDINDHEDRLCELIEGVLVEKCMGFTESNLAIVVGMFLNAFVIPRNLGLIAGADGTIQLMLNLVRIPDVSFVSWDRIPGRRRPTEPVPHLVPNLTVEVLSRGNPPGEMRVKREEYFTAGVELVWEIDPKKRTVAVHTSPTDITTLTENDTLDGGTVLPGFTLPLRQLCGELDRQG